MPAIDKCEDAIIIALEKEGWRVNQKPLSIPLKKKRYLYADLRLENAEGEKIIVVEAKCFPPDTSEIEELYRAIGQYILYRAILKLNMNSTPLFLAIPKDVYLGLFQIASVQEAINDAKIQLLVVDLDQELIVKWSI